MGLFSKLVNKITGGGARVTVMPENPTLSGKFKVTVKAVISDNDLNVNNVYLKIRSIEKARVKNVYFPATSVHPATTKDITGEEEIFKAEYLIDNAKTLMAGQEYTWEYELELPSGALPTFTGRNISHEWEMLAGLDVPGNNPDSGWQKFEVRK